MKLTLVVVAKNQADLRSFDLTHISRCNLVMLSNELREPLSVIGNRYLDGAQTPVLGLAHADCWFGPGALESFAAAAMSGSVAGIVGVSLTDLTYQWCSRNPGLVSTLDSCAVFFRRDSGLRFDAKTFDSLHCHVEDLCLQATGRGVPVVVPAAEATHRSTTANGPEWLNEYHRYRDRLVNKWPDIQFATT